MTTKEHMLTTNEGLPLRLAQWLPSVRSGDKLPVLVFVPGLKGFTNWGSFPYVCERIAESGWAVISMGFSRDGVEGFGSDITKPELAEGNSVTKEIEEVNLLLEQLHQGGLPGANQLNSDLVCLFGHSLGGAVVLSLARDRSDISGVVLWSSISHLGLWPPSVTEEWERNGRYNMPNARTGQDFFLGREFLEDVKNVSKFDFRKNVREVSCPVLLLHGDADDSVPVAQGKELREAMSESQSELHIIKGGDHNFGAVHPFKGTTPQLEEAIEKTINWMSALKTGQLVARSDQPRT